MEEAVQLLKLLRQKKATLAFAESCTGGLASATLTGVEGVSSVFYGGVISYSNKSKVQVLGVDENIIAEHGAVSEPVAKQMALGVREKMETCWGVSITGVAGPSGGTEEKPVGTVCFAVIGPEVEVLQTHNLKGGRKSIQKQSVQKAFEILKESLGFPSS